MSVYKKEEVPGIILGLFIGGIIFGLIYFFGSQHNFMGSGGAVSAVLWYAVFAFFFAVVNKVRRYDHVLFWGIVGAFFGLLVNYFAFAGNIIKNLAESSSQIAFMITIFVAIVGLAYLIAAFALAKHTRLR